MSTVGVAYSILLSLLLLLLLSLLSLLLLLLLSSLLLGHDDYALKQEHTRKMRVFKMVCAKKNLWRDNNGSEEKHWHYACLSCRERHCRAARDTKIDIFWSRVPANAAGEVRTCSSSWLRRRKSTSRKTKEEMDRQYQRGLSLRGDDIRRQDLLNRHQWRYWRNVVGLCNLSCQRAGIQSSSPRH